ncbi:MAG: glycosyltransferase family 39 protein [Jaaginema sp. PMC 1079.18]|nr:glycosyltransferase family 39 protein [Jaaginema sp. PMC 1080.18]MEC4851757.1 glycosyltransferase family 39 protein [Jaaginema sp. PMC 1079.18]MEC4866596.1 glycosyltransferase family 39 protein [Jaaginema sp. PMC 1078.18]
MNLSSSVFQPKSSQIATLVKAIAIIVLLCGIFCRFYDLDRRIYWQDEAITALRIAGYTEVEFIAEVGDRAISVAELQQQYQSPNPNQNLGDTLYSLASEDPQLPPLYFILARWGAQLGGDTVIATRLVAVIFSILVFPALFWLCWELFATEWVGWVAMALVAVSPFHLIFAQEARPYSLWTLTIFLSSATLLRALRVPSRANWGLYSLMVALGLYSFLFNVLVIASHGLYTFGQQGWRWTKQTTAFCIATIIGIVAFLPWAIAVTLNLTQATNQTGWTSISLPLGQLLKQWLNNLSVVFFDGLDIRWTPIELILRYGILALSLYALYYLIRHTEKRVWLFVISLIGVMGLTLILPDLIIGGRRSAVTRYATPCYIGIELAVAYLLTAKMFSLSAPSLWRKVWQGFTIILIMIGLFSQFKVARSVFWWNKGPSNRFPQMAEIIAEAENPLVITDGGLNKMLAFSHRLEEDVSLYLLREKQPDLSQADTTYFFFNSSEEVITDLSKLSNRTLEDIQPKGEIQLYQLTVD